MAEDNEADWPSAESAENSDEFRKALREELRNVVDNYPLDPGDTISHGTAKYLAQHGMIARDTGGRWIPTRKGVREATNHQEL